MTDACEKIGTEEELEKIAGEYRFELGRLITQLQKEFPSSDRYSEVEKGSKEWNFYHFMATRSPICWMKYAMGGEPLLVLYRVCLAAKFNDLIAYVYLVRQKMDPGKNPVGMKFLLKINSNPIAMEGALRNGKINQILHEWDNASLKQELRLIDHPEKTISELSMLSGFNNQDTIFNTSGKLSSFTSSIQKTVESTIPTTSQIVGDEDTPDSPPKKRSWSMRTRNK